VLPPDKLTTALEAFLGTERFTRFLAAGVDPRLRHWQEADLQRFLAAHPEFDAPLEELTKRLRVCELHRLSLQPETVEVVRGCIDWSAPYLKTRAELFPHAAQDSISDEGNADFPSHVQVWYCANCRVARKEWLGKRA
jgi:hypothetical protein